MQHISFSIGALQNYVSRDEVLKSRFIEIAEDFLHIRVKSSQIEIGERLLLVTSLTYAEKLIVSREKASVLGFMHDNKHGFRIEDILVR